MPKPSRKTKPATAPESDEHGQRIQGGVFPVVGIGTSAGGLETLEAFFKNCPVNSGIAFVIVQHLAPTRESIMPELLARRTEMPVLQAKEGVRVEPNHVYVIMSNSTLTIEAGVLHVSVPNDVRDRRTPIDLFFRSLAEDQGANAICIVLSGSGSDGALGLKAIKEHGGMVMAQEASSALHDSMPRSASATGLVDHVLPVERLAPTLVEYTRHMAEFRARGERTLQAEAENLLVPIYSMLRRKTGHDFSQYKVTTFLRRVQRRMQVHRLVSLAAYVEKLRAETAEVENLFRDLLIGVTHFFRDPEVFEELEGEVLPELVAIAQREGGVRVWVAGCATGEEAFTLAMLLHERFSLEGTRPTVQIFATDIDEDALNVARQGRYADTITAQMAPKYIERYFRKQGSMYQVVKEIREMCVFSSHNLIKDPPFSRLDLVTCRNLLIYLSAELQKKVVPIFHYALRGSGYLLLGPSENITGHSHLFGVVSKTARIFRRKDSGVSTGLSIPHDRGGRRSPEEGVLRPHKAQPNLGRTLERLVLEQYAPACVVVNANHEVVFVSGRTGKYLELPPGAPDVNIVNLARRGLRLNIRSALQRASKENQPVVLDNAVMETPSGRQRVRILAHPVEETGRDAGLVMLTFQDLASVDLVATTASQPDENAVVQLENELRVTKEHLQTTVEELENSNEELKVSNEELMSLNEELQSSNEELETSKEELQSVNEELETVNVELSKKIEELDRANSDLLNLFESTKIATVFLDKNLRIQSFTPAIRPVLRLIEADRGRSITDFAPNLDGIDLAGDARDVLRNLTERQRQAKLRDSELLYAVRILPYRTVADVVDGVVITFTDITALRQAEVEQMRLARIVASAQDAIIGKTLDGTVTSWNRGAERLYGYRAEEIVGKNIRTIVPPDRMEEVDEFFRRLGRGEDMEPLETVRVRKDGSRVEVLLALSVIRDARERVTGVSVIARDITERNRARRELELAAERIRARVLQLQAIAEISEVALGDSSLELLAERIVSTVAATLNLPLCKILELLPGGERMILRAGVGWKDGLVGRGTVDTGGNSQAGFTLASSAPIIVRDLRTEPRFSGPSLLVDHGVVSGMSVIIAGADQRPFGVLGAHDTRVRAFSDDDVRFLQAVANCLTLALQRVARENAERRARHELKEHLAELEVLMESAPVAIWIAHDHECRKITGNRAGSEMLRMGVEDNLSKADPSTRHFEVFQDGRRMPSEELPVQKAARTGQPQFAQEMELRFDDGVTVWEYGNVAPLLDDAGKPRGAIGTFLDITRLKQTQEELRLAQAALREHAESLEHLVAERTAALRDKIEQLEMFTYSISHDLRGPLRSLEAFSEILLEDYSEALAPEARDLLGRIARSAHRLSDLTHDLLAYTKVSRDQIQLVPVVLHPLVVDLIAQIPEIENRRAEVQVAPSLPVVIANEMLLTQILTNLLVNAVKFTPANRTPVIQITGETDGAIARVKVTDNGVGIDPRYFATIFELFNRLDVETEGTGIGLALCKKAVDRMGGRIFVESSPGQGATFIVELPTPVEQLNP